MEAQSLNHWNPREIPLASCSDITHLAELSCGGLQPKFSDSQSEMDLDALSLPHFPFGFHCFGGALLFLSTHLCCSRTTLYRNDLFLCLFAPPTILATLGRGTIMTCFRTTSQGGRGCLGRRHRRLLADMKTMWRCLGENMLLIHFENPGSQEPPPGPSSRPTLSRRWDVLVVAT